MERLQAESITIEYEKTMWGRVHHCPVRIHYVPDAYTRTAAAMLVSIPRVAATERDAKKIKTIFKRRTGRRLEYLWDIIKDMRGD